MDRRTFLVLPFAAVLVPRPGPAREVGKPALRRAAPVRRFRLLSDLQRDQASVVACWVRPKHWSTGGRFGVPVTVHNSVGMIGSAGDAGIAQLIRGKWEIASMVAHFRLVTR